MHRISAVFCLVALAATMNAVQVQAEDQFQVLTDKTFSQALPAHFYLEGQAIPTQKRNAALVKTPSGARVLFGLLDTSGYGTDITEKYHGMLITETKLSVCGNSLEVGSYGFGMKVGADPDQPKTFNVFDQAGKKVCDCEASRDAELKQPRPLQVVPGKEGAARFYVGRDFVEVK